MHVPKLRQFTSVTGALRYYLDRSSPTCDGYGPQSFLNSLFPCSSRVVSGLYSFVSQWMAPLWWRKWRPARLPPVGYRPRFSCPREAKKMVHYCFGVEISVDSITRIPTSLSPQVPIYVPKWPTCAFTRFVPRPNSIHGDHADAPGPTIFPGRRTVTNYHRAYRGMVCARYVAMRMR